MIIAKNNTRYLFVCHIGRMRSLTAYVVATTEFHLRADYCGTEEAKFIGYSNVVSIQHMCWADHIIVFGIDNLERLYDLYPRISQKITLWDIPDEYDALDPVLIALCRLQITVLLYGKEGQFP